MTLNPGRENIGQAAENATVLQGLEPTLQKQLGALLAASNGKVRVFSGLRTPQEQAAAQSTAQQRYPGGQPNDWFVSPQDSNHVKGAAADLAGDLTVAHQLAPQFGISFPMSWEPWHAEMSSTLTNSAPGAYTNPPPGETNPTVADMSQSAPHAAAALGEAMMGANLLGTTSTATQGSSPLDEAQSMLTDIGGTQQGAGANPLGELGAITPTGETGTTGAAPSVDANGQPIPNLPYQPGGGGAFGGVPQQQWAVDFLNTIKMPVTPENVKFMTAWEQAESGGGGGAFNPLNTTQDMPGDSAYNDNNGDPVKNYAAYADGLQANATAINNGRYQPILDALKQGTNAMSAAQALAASPWGTGGLVAKILASGQ